MAYHSIILSKIEMTMDTGALEDEPAFWTNFLPDCKETGIAVAGEQTFIDVTRHSDYYPNTTYTSNAAHTIWVEGVGWRYNTAGVTDTIASWDIALSATYEELYDFTIFAELGWDSYSNPPYSPASLRLTFDVTTALSGASAEIPLTFNHPDASSLYYFVRRDGGDENDPQVQVPITATGTGADIKQYAYIYDWVKNPSYPDARWDTEGIERW